MSESPSLWLPVAGLLAVEAALSVGVTALLQRWVRSALWRRLLWQICFVSLAVLFLAEFFGVARGVGGWLGQELRLAWRPTKVQSFLQPSSPFPQSRPQPRSAYGESALSYPAEPRSGAAGPAAGARWTSTALESWLAYSWLGGAVILLGYIGLTRLLWVFTRRGRWRMVETVFEPRMAQMAGTLGLRRRVRLVEAAGITSPVAFGVWRPTIGLPRDFSRTFTVTQQEAILAHELAHLAWRDPIWFLLADVTTALLWWHPLVWWARRRFREAAEAAADEASLLVTNGPGILAECLVRIGGQLPLGRGLGWIAMGGFRSQLGQRVERLMALGERSWAPPKRWRRGLAEIFGPAALLTAALVCSAWASPQASGEPMKSLTWKRSLAGVAMAAVFGTGNGGSAAEPQKQPPAGAQLSAVAEGEGPEIRKTLLHVALTNHASDQASAGRQAISAKLAAIVLPEVQYDGLPLAEVVRGLIVESTKRDPEKRGVNFLIVNRLDEPAPAPIDPATGLPLTARGESLDLNTVTIRILPALRNVRLMDVLDAVTKVADYPIQYTIEPYAVVFSFSPLARLQSTSALVPPPAAVEPLRAATFHLGATDLYAGVLRVFRVDRAATRSDLKNFLSRLGVDMNVPGKSAFFNEQNGVLMVRATPEDLDLVKAAIETLSAPELVRPGLGAETR